MDGGHMTETPVGDEIEKICIINDREAVTHGTEKPSLYSTKGILFYLAGGEISFEVSIWFSEMIAIRLRQNRIDEFSPIEEFYEECGGCDGVYSGCFPRSRLDQMKRSGWMKLWFAP
ncbi:MAG: hypothetical protein PUC44_04740 [Eubacteriales bacterium]|nr:hypothetical protein [Eubacteriales bacterium]